MTRLLPWRGPSRWGPRPSRRVRRRRGLGLAAGLLALTVLLAACDLGGSPPRPPTATPGAAAPSAQPAASAPSPAASAPTPIPPPASSPPPASGQAPSAAPPPPVVAVGSPSPGASPGASPVAKPGGGGEVVANQGQLSGTIKIVSSLPRTGNSKPQTDAIVDAVRMAIDEARGRVENAMIIYEDLDDTTPDHPSWDAAKETENANRAVDDQDVMVYIGPYNSGAARVSIPILNKAGLVMISPSNTYAGLTRPNRGLPNEPGVYYPDGTRTYSRVIPADDVQGAVAAGWAKQLGAQKVYVLDDADVFGHMVATVFAETAARIGLEVVGGPEGVDPKAQDYRSIATKVRGANPDLVYFGGTSLSNAGRLFRELKSTLPDNVKLMGSDGIYDQTFLDEAGDAAEGAYITFGGVAPSKLTGRGAEWYRSFKVRYNVEPEVYASYAYEAAKVGLDAIKRAGRKDRAAIREAVLATKDFDGIFGRWSFDANGDTTLTAISGRQVKEGHFDDANAETLQAP